MKTEIEEDVITVVEVPGAASGTLMTKEYVQMVGQMAYIWGWPLVNMGNRSIAFNKLPAPGLIGGVLPAAFNGVCMLSDYVSPNQRAVACPNQDVAYGFGVSQLDQDAIVVQVPDFGDRLATIHPEPHSRVQPAEAWNMAQDRAVVDRTNVPVVIRRRIAKMCDGVVLPE